MDDRASLGRKGERAAERYLRRLGCKIVTRNYKCPLGELDLVVLDKDTVVFAEVKTRRGDDHAEPHESVTWQQQQRIHRAAQHFLAFTRSQHRACRFDVVAVSLDDAGKMACEHYPGAFEPSSEIRYY
jgi:putative endonuclease